MCERVTCQFTANILAIGKSLFKKKPIYYANIGTVPFCHIVADFKGEHCKIHEIRITDESRRKAHIHPRDSGATRPQFRTV